MSPDVSLEIERSLIIHENGLVLCRAGLPGYPSNFTRDSIHSFIFNQNLGRLRDQLQFNSESQAKDKDPFSGAEPGKFHHQLPCVLIRNHSTAYSASDVTAWGLVGFEDYFIHTGDSSFLKEHEFNIRMGTDYILNHLTSDYLFEDSPQFAGADNFALKVTYWKDSQLPQRENGEPDYPVVYWLADVQNIAGMRSSARLLHSNDLLSVASKMVESLDGLFDEDLGTYPVAVDQQGPVRVVSSDGLTSFYFLEPEDIGVDRLSRVIQTSAILETPVGYRVLSEEAAEEMEDKYHADTVWPLEQATIHAGARKYRHWAQAHGFLKLAEELGHVMEVSSRVINFLEGHNAEIFILRDGHIEKVGCDPHLMTLAAKSYFEQGRSSLASKTKELSIVA